MSIRKKKEILPGDAERPYERCTSYGPGVLTDAELIAVILRTGTAGRDAVDVANEVLARVPQGTNLAGLYRMKTEDFRGISGIGKVKAVQLSCIGELARRMSREQARMNMDVENPASVAEYYMERLRHSEQEHVICMMLDTRCHMIGDETITIGTCNGSLLSPREVFISALRQHAVNIILIHNHPSGDPEPSEADCIVTERVRKAGMVLDIRLHDHIIIGDRRYYSFYENDML